MVERQTFRGADSSAHTALSRRQVGSKCRPADLLARRRMSICTPSPPSGLTDRNWPPAEGFYRPWASPGLPVNVAFSGCFYSGLTIAPTLKPALTDVLSKAATSVFIEICVPSGSFPVRARPPVRGNGPTGARTNNKTGVLNVDTYTNL